MTITQGSRLFYPKIKIPGRSCEFWRKPLELTTEEKKIQFLPLEPLFYCNQLNEFYIKILIRPRCDSHIKSSCLWKSIRMHLDHIMKLINTDKSNKSISLLHDLEKLERGHEQLHHPTSGPQTVVLWSHQWKYRSLHKMQQVWYLEVLVWHCNPVVIVIQ